MGRDRAVTYVAKIGGAATTLILFASLVIKYYTHLDGPGRTARDKAREFIDILIDAVGAVRESFYHWYSSHLN